MASVATPTAVSKPKVSAVPGRSLSIVFGTPTTGSPCCESAWAMRIEPSPPMAISASMPRRWKLVTTSGVRSTMVTSPEGSFSGQRSGLPLLVAPRMLPPRWVMARTDSRSSCTSFSGSSSPS